MNCPDFSNRPIKFLLLTLSPETIIASYTINNFPSTSSPSKTVPLHALFGKFNLTGFTSSARFSKAHTFFPLNVVQTSACRTPSVFSHTTYFSFFKVLK